MKLTNITVLKQVLFSALIILLIINCSSDSSSSAPTPEISVVGSSLSFGNVDEMSHSASQSISVSGSDLTSVISIAASNNFQVSLDDTAFSNQVTLNNTTATIASTTIYVRFSPLENSIGNITGSLSIQSSDAQSVSVNLRGVGVSTDPIINVNHSNLVFTDTMVLEESASLNILVNGDNLTSVINLNANDNFQISLDNNTFTDDVQIDVASVNDDTTVYVRFIPTNIETYSGTLTLQSTGADDVQITLSGTGIPVIHNYSTFDDQALGFGGGYNQSESQTFNLHTDLSNIESIKMFLKIDCPNTGCDDWDRFANIKVKDQTTGNWFEIGRYITPYWTGTQQLNRGLEFDVTDFKSLLTGMTEIRIYIENWTAKADLISLEFDYTEGTPDYPYYSVSEVLGYHANSIDGVPYGVTHSFDLNKTIQIPANAESTHLRSIISGWGHATPNDPNGRPCAEWCYRTHDVKINGNNTFQHYLGPIGCASNPVSNQSPGNWQPDRAGWCPGMAVPVRMDDLGATMSGNTFTFEYDFEDWVNDGSNGSAYYATSTYVIVKSNTAIDKPVVTD